MMVALGALLGMLGGVVTASSAFAGGRGDGWQIVSQPHLDLPGGVFCAFPVGVDFPVNREYMKELKASDGSTLTLFTGSLTGSFTNQDTGKTITVNLSGPYKVTAFPDHSATVAFRGLTGIIITQDQAKQLGLPPLSVISGATAVSVAPDGTFTSVSPRGAVLVDICAALS
jgi:hypothetical protein